MDWTKYTQAKLDQEFDNQRTVVDYEAVIEEWQRASAIARDASETQANFRYGSHARALLDFYPSLAGDGKCLIFFHGGFWRSFNKEGLAFLAPALNSAGISLVLPNYPIAPSADMATIVVHANEAIRWVLDHSREIGVDRSEIWVAGHSAGAHLALMASITCLARQDIKGWLAVSGIYDLAPIRACYLNETLSLSQSDVALYSPAYFAPQVGRLIMAVGSRETDQFRSQSAALAAKWRRLGTVVEHHMLTGIDHYEAVRCIGRPGNALLAAVISAMNGRALVNAYLET